MPPPPRRRHASPLLFHWPPPRRPSTTTASGRRPFDGGAPARSASPWPCPPLEARTSTRERHWWRKGRGSPPAGAGGPPRLEAWRQGTSATSGWWRHLAAFLPRRRPAGLFRLAHCLCCAPTRHWRWPHRTRRSRAAPAGVLRWQWRRPRRAPRCSTVEPVPFRPPREAAAAWRPTDYSHY